MALLERTPHRKRTLDLNGPDGNAWALLGYAKQWGSQMGIDVRAIQKEMQSSNYKHLVETFDKHFGVVVDLILPEGGL
jgi:hypothetical protein